MVLALILAEDVFQCEESLHTSYARRCHGRRLPRPLVYFTAGCDVAALNVCTGTAELVAPTFRQT